MCRHSITGICFAPLYIHSVKLLQPHTLVQAEKFNIIYNETNLPTTTADKLRYYRYQKGLLQRDVADFADIDRSTYNSYESSERDSFPLDKMALVAQLLEIDIADLLDEYNLFIYHGQGLQIRAKRKARGLTQFEFGKLYGVNKHTVTRWENDDVRIFKSTWEKLFK